jgi:PHD/YefM family antitoxin component YafN of YafNO toxin-antitoxin module
MSTEITYIEAEANLENLCDRAVEAGEVIVITRPNCKNAVLFAGEEYKSLLETLEITYADAEANLENLCNRAVDTGEVIVITRPNGKNAFFISEVEFKSLIETIYTFDSIRMIS